MLSTTLPGLNRIILTYTTRWSTAARFLAALFRGTRPRGKGSRLGIEAAFSRIAGEAGRNQRVDGFISGLCFRGLCFLKAIL